MVASAARMQANRTNAQKSTGPRTASGKEKSRANAVKHGLCSTILGIEEPEAVAGRSEELGGTYNLGNWLVRQVATLSIRVEHAQEMQEAARERISLRASVVWEDDRRLEAIVLGDQIAQRPEYVLERLRQTPQGCDWLISRWAMLAHAADRGAWTPEQTSLALDLLGDPLDFRLGEVPGTVVDTEGRPTGQSLSPAALARSQVAELQQRREIVEKLDTLDRQNAQAGLSDDAELRRLRRYEMALQRQLRWAFDLLQEATAPPPPVAAASEPPAQPQEPSAPTPTPEKTERDRPQPPRRSATRAEKKLNKAEARREARERKLEKLRS